MKKLLAILISASMLFGCSQYDDLDNRIKTLEEQYKQMNTNISSLQKILNAMQENLTISKVQKTTDGYIIHFSDGSTVSIDNGKEGDAVTALVTVEKDVDGIYYWTLNGKWLRDGAGKKINAQQEGAVIPRLKIQNDRWLVSLDNGETWNHVNYVTGGDANNRIFKSVTEDKDNVYFTLEDNSVITIPKGDRTQFAINFDSSDIAIPKAGETGIISYTITGATDKTIVKTVCQDGWKAKVDATSTAAGTITITAPETIVGSEILVFANDGSFRTAMAVIDCQKGFITVADDTYEVATAGGNREVKLTTNVNYTVEIPENDKEWISLTETRAVRDEVLTFAIKPNTGFSRSSIVKLIYNNEVIQTIGFSQAGDYSEEKGIILATESDILALQKDNTEIIEGSLAISGSSITTLALLNNQIKEITGSLIIDCSSLTSFEGLSGLTKIGGDLLVIQGKVVNFQGLTNLQEIAGNLTIESYSVLPVSTVDPALNLLKTFEGLNNLKRIGGDFEIYAGSNAVDHNPLEALESFEGLNNLQEIAGSFKITAVSIDSKSCLNSLKTFNGLGSLKKIGGDFDIRALSKNYGRIDGLSAAYSLSCLSSLESFEGLNNLQEIAGNFRIKAESYGSPEYIAYSLNSLKTFNGLSSLKRIGGDFDIRSDASKVSYALNSLESFEGLSNLQEIAGNYKIMAESVQSKSSLNSLKTFNGLSSLTKIGGSFEVYSSTRGSEPASGDFSSLNLLESFEGLNNLQEIKGNLKITTDTATATTTASYTDLNSFTTLNGLSGLRSIGNITISQCQKLSDISSLGGVTSVVKNITISNCTSLYSFSALKPLVQQMTGVWSVTGCNFNPTKDQVLNDIVLPK